jgi:hypothetical protein
VGASGVKISCTTSDPEKYHLQIVSPFKKNGNSSTRGQRQQQEYKKIYQNRDYIRFNSGVAKSNLPIYKYPSLATPADT